MSVKNYTCCVGKMSLMQQCSQNTIAPVYRESVLCIVVFVFNYKVFCTLAYYRSGNFELVHVLVKMLCLLFENPYIKDVA